MPIESLIRLKSYTLMQDDVSIELVAQIVIECPVCGETVITVAGHHLQPLVQLLQDLIAREPSVTRSGDCVLVTTSEKRIYPENN